MIPLHEIVIKITQPANNYSYTAIISEAGKSKVGTTSKLLGTIRISVSDYVRLNVSFNVLFYKLFVYPSVYISFHFPILKSSTSAAHLSCENFSSLNASQNFSFHNRS